jgi:hypothetical protein
VALEPLIVTVPELGPMIFVAPVNCGPDVQRKPPLSTTEAVACPFITIVGPNVDPEFIISEPSFSSAFPFRAPYTNTRVAKVLDLVVKTPEYDTDATIVKLPPDTVTGTGVLKVSCTAASCV